MRSRTKGPTMNSNEPGNEDVDVDGCPIEYCGQCGQRISQQEMYAQMGYQGEYAVPAYHEACRPNEQGNATAAFQVGDRVRWTGQFMAERPTFRVTAIKSGGWVRMEDDQGNEISTPARYITLIARATPAPTPDLLTCEQCGNMGYEDSWPFVAACQIVAGQDRVTAVLCGDCRQDAALCEGGTE